MKHRSSPCRGLVCGLLAVLLGPVSALSVAAETAFTVEDLVSLPAISGTPPARPVWSPDGSQLAFLWNDHGMPFLDVWVSDAQGGTLRRLTRLSEGGDAAVPFGEHIGADLSLEALSREAAARHARGVSDLAWSQDGRSLFVSYRGRILVVDAASANAHELIDSPGGKSRLALAPDGSHLAFLQGGDLWLYRFDGDYLLQATRVGAPTISRIPEGRFATPDSGFASLAWSPDSRYIALEYVDQRAAGIMPIPSYIHPEPVLHGVRRVYPGAEGVTRKVALYDRRDGQVRHLDLPDPLHRTVLNLEWAPAGAPRLLVHQDSYDGEHRWIYVADPATRAFTEVYADYRPQRIYAIFNAVWSSDGRQIVFVSDHEDYYQLYAVGATGGAIKRLTRGAYDVAGPGRAPAMLAASGGRLFFTSTEHSPAERHVFRMAEGGGTTTRVTRLPGTHDDATLSPDGKRLAVIASNDSTPPELYVLDAGGGEEQRITHSPLPAFARFPMGTVRYVTFPSRIDDFTLHARIVEPPNLDPSKRYPVIIGSVYSATARNHWPAPRPLNELQHWMATDGDYITVQTDLRGSAGYGVAFREAFQGDWGGGDLEDLHSTVDYLKTLPYVDPDRIGIWGNSYGGMMVLFALFERPGMFAAGISGSPAIDVRYFTQNDMHLSRREHTHPEIFAQSSLLNYGDKLQDPLLFIHGFHDDIVPFKTTAEMMEKLMLLGKDFDMVVPPQSAHWWAYPEHYAVHTFRKFMQFFERHLGKGAR